MSFSEQEDLKPKETKQDSKPFEIEKTQELIGHINTHATITMNLIKHVGLKAEIYMLPRPGDTESKFVSKIKLMDKYSAPILNQYGLKISMISALLFNLADGSDTAIKFLANLTQEVALKMLSSSEDQTNE